MQPTKQVVLFIVEGPTDEDAFSEVMKGIFENDMVVFHVVHGDIMIDPQLTPDTVVKAVNEHVKVELDRYGLKRSDIQKIIHLIDTDGAFIPPENVKKGNQEQIEYTLEHILSANPEGTKRRNQRKRQLIQKLFSIKAIAGTPYAIYYLSRNLEHVLFDRIDTLTDAEKIELADSFADQYENDINAFITFISENCFTVEGNYSETWNHIMCGINSLQRKSNLHLAIPNENIVTNNE